jgi:aspartyl protease family protein
MSQDGLIALAVAAILAGTLGWRLQYSQPRVATALRNGAYLAMLAAGLLVVFDFARRADDSDARLLMAGASETEVKGGATVLTMQPDGHYWVEARINGTPARFMIDTGASYVSLTADTARAAGITATPGEAPLEMGTANGTMLVHFGTVDRLDFGTIAARNIDVAISPDNAGEINLIGMNLLSQLGSWRAEGKQLILTP